MTLTFDRFKVKNQISDKKIHKSVLIQSIGNTTSTVMKFFTYDRFKLNNQISDKKIQKSVLIQPIGNKTNRVHEINFLMSNQFKVNNQTHKSVTQ